MGREQQTNPGYKPSWNTDVMDTLKRHGFKPMTKEERAKKLKAPLRSSTNVCYLPKRGKA